MIDRLISFKLNRNSPQHLQQEHTYFWVFSIKRYGKSGDENSCHDWYVRGGRAIIRVSDSIVVSSLRMEGHLTLTFALFWDKIEIVKKLKENLKEVITSDTHLRSILG